MTSTHIYKNCLIALLLVLVFSCKKFGHGYIKGTVVDAGTSQTIPGAVVLLQHWKSNCSECPYLWDSVYTDSQGYFIMYFKRQVNHEYTLRAHHKTHYSKVALIDFERHNEVKIPMIANKYVKFRIQKTSNSDNSLDVFYSIAGSFSFQHNGRPVDTLLAPVHLIEVNYGLEVKWTVTKPTKEFQSYYSKPDDPVINQGDTVIYTIQYQ